MIVVIGVEFGRTGDLVIVRAAHEAVHVEGEVSGTEVQPGGAHALACGLKAPVSVTIEGHCGYYAAGMNQENGVVPCVDEFMVRAWKRCSTKIPLLR